MKKLMIAAILILCGITACGDKTDPDYIMNTIDKKTYVLVSPFGDKNITISFNGNKISGFSGVNRYMGSVNAAKNGFVFSDISTTRMAGDHKSASIEKEYIANLRASSKIYVNNKEIRIGNMVFKEE